MKVLQINTVYGVGSTGRIVRDLNNAILSKKYNGAIAFGRGRRPKNTTLCIYKIGSMICLYSHVLLTRIADRNGFGSKMDTIKFIKFIEEYQPDIIHLHNIHGYYINIHMLFEYFSDQGIPIIWTLHDCWSFTGHCAYYDYEQCDKWKKRCHKCPQLRRYPSSWLFDRSAQNYKDKMRLFNSINDLTILTPSNWLSSQVKESFLKKYPVRTFYNGIDLSAFNPSKNEDNQSLRRDLKISSEYVVIGVANLWEKRKGLDYFIQLSKIYNNNIRYIIVGISKKQQSTLPKNMIGIVRTNSINELAALYSLADVFVNPTLEETFGLTNVEALACGTPVITFNTGGSPEAIDETCGIVVEKGSIEGLVNAIEYIRNNPFSPEACRKRAMMFDKNDKYAEYIKLYEEILAKQA